MSKSVLLAAVLLCLTAAPHARAAKRDIGFLAGADCSHVGFFETHGKVYRDGDQPKDPFVILKTHGVNCIRLRVYTSSDEQAKRDPYNAVNNLHYTIPLAVRAKKAGLKLLIDFHYSDTWADPGNQKTPDAWKDLTFDRLEQQMYAYNRDSIAALRRAGAMPDYVQIGNETPGGLLWPMGKVGGAFDTPEQWRRLGLLMSAAARGIAKSSGAQKPKIIVHLDRGGDWGTTKWFFDHLTAEHVPFDLIGESYYPYWHGTLDQLRECLNHAAERYHKPVVIAETDFPWSEQDSLVKSGAPLAGIPAGKPGQTQFVQILGAIVKAVPNGLGAGIFWWGAEYLPLEGIGLADFDKRSFFDADGNCTPALDAFGRLAR